MPEQDLNKDSIRALKGLRTIIGITEQPGEGDIQIGTDRNGNVVYGKRKLAQSDAADAGEKYVSNFLDMMTPFKVLTKEDVSSIDKVKGVARDAQLIGVLTQHAANKDAKKFVDTLLGRYGKRLAKGVLKDPKQQGTASSALGAYLLFSNWENLSPAQKSLGIARTGLEAASAISSTQFLKKPIPNTQSAFSPKGLNVGQALNSLSAGFNSYSLAKNWDQMDGVSRLLGTTGTAAETIQVAQSLGLTGSGVNGAAVANVTAESLASAGANLAPSYGVGAITVASEGAVPAGYVGVASAAEGGVVAVPQATAQSSSISVSSALGNVAGVAAIAAGAHTLYKGWGTGGAKGRLNGAIGGSSMAAGLYALGATNPFLLGGVAALSVLGGSIKTGKHADQVKRDSVRSRLKEIGVVDNDFAINLPDGTVANLGLDGDSGRHTFRQGDRAAKSQEAFNKENGLGAYDIDYTNDLDFFTGMGGVALSRLINGGKATNIDQLGGQIGNAALGKVGYGADLSPENFGVTMQNMRAIYAKAGVKNKEEAYALANRAYEEGRINDSDLVTMHQAFNMVFDNDFNVATTLSQGRWKGVEVIDKQQKVPQDDISQGISSEVVQTPSQVGAEVAEVATTNEPATANTIDNLQTEIDIQPVITPDSEANAGEVVPTETITEDGLNAIERPIALRDNEIDLNMTPASPELASDLSRLTGEEVRQEDIIAL